MPRNTAAGKAAVGPANTSDGEIVAVLTIKELASYAARKTTLQRIAR